MANSIYVREKRDKRWRYRRIPEGRGIRTSNLEGPFFARPTLDGKQIWQRLDAATFAEAIRYKFFLGSGRREKEVTFQSWSDLNFERGTYTVRSKPERITSSAPCRCRKASSRNSRPASRTLRIRAGFS